LNIGTPDVLIAGHAVIDVITDSRTSSHPRIALGGPVSYSCIALSSLGYVPEIVTKVGYDFPVSYSELLREKGRVDIERFRLNGDRTTSYRIDRTTDPRKMWLVAKCRNISRSDFFDSDSGRVHSQSKALVVNSVAGELSLSLLDRVSKEFDLVLVDSQGFVRNFSKDGEVGMRSGLDISSLSGVDFLKSDRAELSAWSGTADSEVSIRQLSKFVDCIILTSGSESIQVFHGRDLEWRIKPPDFLASDTTGAGDIFLSVFAAELSRTDDVRRSLALATGAGSLAIQRFGIEKAILDPEIVRAVSEKIDVLKC
jgi:sugar/nucleoside kinase (ribokinase family)